MNSIHLEHSRVFVKHMCHPSVSGQWHHLETLEHPHPHEWTEGIKMQSDGIGSPVHRWKPCMTQHHMCILHTRAGAAIQAVQRRALRVCFLKHFFLFLSVFACACVHVTSIWWIKSNALILSQTRPPLRARLCEKLHPLRSPRVIQGGGGKQCNNFLLTHVCPKTNKLSPVPLRSSKSV